MPGDLLGGSLFASEHRGQSMIELLNATRVDYCLLGNHEFDYGDDRLRELMDMSNFPWLGSNVREQVPEKAMFHTTMDLDVFWVRHGGVSVKVGIFGLCTPATPQLSHPSEKVIFEDLIFHAKRREEYEIQVTSPRVLCWKQNLLHCKILFYASFGGLVQNPPELLSTTPHETLTESPAALPTIFPTFASKHLPQTLLENFRVQPHNQVKKVTLFGVAGLNVQTGETAKMPRVMIYYTRCSRCVYYIVISTVIMYCHDSRAASQAAFGDWIRTKCWK